MSMSTRTQRPHQSSLSEVPAVAEVQSLEPTPPGGPSGILDLTRTVPLGDAAPRSRAQVSGTVTSMTVRMHAATPILDVCVADSTGDLLASFFGRRSIGGITLGGALTVEGMVLRRSGELAMLNPAYDLRSAR